MSTVNNFILSNTGERNKILIKDSNIEVKNLSSPAEITGIRDLSSHATSDAMHSSGQMANRPLCHGRTREDVRNHILDWLYDSNDQSLAMWMHGPAGSGTSTIALTLAHQCQKVAASFFFCRTSQNRKRNDRRALIPTLAYQLSLNVRETAGHIDSAVLRHPLVFDSSLKEQMDFLLVSPLSEAAMPSDGPFLILIDALDECDHDSDDPESQEYDDGALKPKPLELLIDALLTGLKKLHDNGRRTFKLLITSRSDFNINSLFRSHRLGESVRRLDLGNGDWDTNNDICMYLNDKFAEIRKDHIFFRSFVNRSLTWPSPSEIKTLVARASGQFIYAAVVVAYIKSLPENRKPTDSLEAILKVQTAKESRKPYARLDALYSHIFSRIPNISDSLEILSLQRVYAACNVQEPLNAFMAGILGMDIEQIKYRLRHLLSLMRWDDSGFQILHASLTEFLLNRERSAEYFVNTKQIAHAIVGRMSVDPSQLRHFRRLRPVITYYSRELADPSDRVAIFKLATKFDIVDMWRGWNRAQRYDNIREVRRYIWWMLGSLENKETPQEARSMLEARMLSIRKWSNSTIDNNRLLFNLGSSPSTDLWPFFMMKYCVSFNNDPRKEFRRDISSMLAICQLHPIPLRDVGDDDTILLWYIIPRCPSWGIQLLGSHVFVEEQFTVSFVHVCRYLLHILHCKPRAKLLAGPFSTGIFEPYVPKTACIAARAFCIFLDRIRTSNCAESGLCLFACHVKSVLDTVPRREAETSRLQRMLLTLNAFLNKKHRQYPALADPTSSDVVQLQQTAAKSSWIRVVSDFWNPGMYLAA